MKLPRRKFLHLAWGAAALSAVSLAAHAEGYPTPAGTVDRRVCSRRRQRHHRALDGPMAVRSPWTTVRYRKPAGCGHQPRHRGRCQCGARWLHDLRPRPRARSTRHSMKNLISISSATSRRSRLSCAFPTSWWSIHLFRPKRSRSSLRKPIGNPAQDRQMRSFARRRFMIFVRRCAGPLTARASAPSLTDLLGGQVQV